MHFFLTFCFWTYFSLSFSLLGCLWSSKKFCRFALGTPIAMKMAKNTKNEKYITNLCSVTSVFTLPLS